MRRERQGSDRRPPRGGPAACPSPLPERASTASAIEAEQLDWVTVRIFDRMCSIGLVMPDTQAGARRLLIDPYLSNTFARRYKGTDTPQERMERPALDPVGLGRIDLVRATHPHADQSRWRVEGPPHYGGRGRSHRALAALSIAVETRCRLGVGSRRPIFDAEPPQRVETGPTDWGWTPGVEVAQAEERAEAIPE